MPSYQSQKDYWNKVAYDKEFTTPFQIQLFSEFVSKQDKVLDIGCGYGRTLNELSTQGFKNLYGIDFSQKMIERGKTDYPNLNLSQQNNKNIPFEDNTFDAIILFAVLTCIINDDDQTFLFDEIKRVLKPNGIIYINDFLINTDERNITRYNKYKDKYNKYGVFELPEGALLRHHEVNWIETLTSTFKKVKFKKVTYTTMNGNKSNGFYYLGFNVKK